MSIPSSTMLGSVLAERSAVAACPVAAQRDGRDEDAARCHQLSFWDGCLRERSAVAGFGGWPFASRQNNAPTLPGLPGANESGYRCAVRRPPMGREVSAGSAYSPTPLGFPCACESGDPQEAA
eukprot:4247944-Pyramimonas_sp.AAC.1